MLALIHACREVPCRECLEIRRQARAAGRASFIQPGQSVGRFPSSPLVTERTSSRKSEPCIGLPTFRFRIHSFSLSLHPNMLRVQRSTTLRAPVLARVVRLASTNRSRDAEFTPAELSNRVKNAPLLRLVESYRVRCLSPWGSPDGLPETRSSCGIIGPPGPGPTSSCPRPRPQTIRIRLLELERRAELRFGDLACAVHLSGGSL